MTFELYGTWCCSLMTMKLDHMLQRFHYDMKIIHNLKFIPLTLYALSKGTSVFYLNEHHHKNIWPMFLFFKWESSSQFLMNFGI